MLIKTAAVANHQARRQTFGICLLLALVTIAVYWPVARCNFVGYDDPSYVAANPHVESGLRWNNILWAFQSGVAGNWHPVTLLSHMLDCEFFGVRPAWHHLTNLALHTANTLLVFICLRSITGAFWRSALVAALFSLHPLRVESVAWISERKDVLSGFFGILALLAYGRYAREAWAGQRVEGEIEQAVLTNPDPKKRKLKF
ncbi:MAG TPA: hypothetical protein VLT36_04775, partial [Candidatus Dormibacteraeota bacterium]|nr:hypothetical protein [Candidatus Dormibacteraeota bacterium]